MGFTPYRKRDFICCHGDILHVVALQLSDWGSKDFAVNYGAMPLFPPTEYVYLPTGSRLADEFGTINHPQYTFMKACCEVKIGHRDARITLERAISLLQRFLREHPDAAWVVTRLAEATALARAIDNGSEQRLLDAWAQATATTLKIQRAEPAT